MTTWGPDQLERVPCDGCGSDGFTDVFVRPDGMRVVECPRCGLAYLNPRPRADQVHLLYDEAYFGNTETRSRIGYESYLDPAVRVAHEATATNRIDLVRARVPVERKRVLEIGCATGEFCSAIARRNASVVGLDLSKEVIEVAMSRYPQIDFRAGDIGDAVGKDTFDVIFGWEVIEHVSSPSKFVADVVAHLKPGGYVVLSTPNYACAKQVNPSRWTGFQRSFEHLYFFDRSALEQIGRRHGLSLVTSMTGGGSGLPEREPRFRAFTRKLLSATGTLSTMRRLRSAAKPNGIGYSSEDENQHNLIVIFQQGTVAELHK